MTRCLLPVLLLLLNLSGGAARADEVGRFANDWTGNGLVVEAFADPAVTGVTCDVVHFDRSVIDRLTKGNWFENPSNSAISCTRTGPVTVGKIALGPKGEEIFSQRMSLFFKSIAVRRIYDQKNDTLIYVAYSRQIKDASAKMGLSTVSLYDAHPTWIQAKP
ncbi:MAG TPA: CreA family protein [Stellaceae bacterium]|jgi:CreA protein|nr:CreA family protein [Stellaceae bacterium]